MTSARRPHPSLGSHLAVVSLTACTVFLLSSARPIGAGSAAPPLHGALSSDVAVDGLLAREGTGWVVKLRAFNPGASERRCEIAAGLTSIRANPMARALPMPKLLWESTVALAVPANGRSDRDLSIPSEVGERIVEPSPADEASPLAVRETFGVRVRATCAVSSGDRVG